MLLVKEQLGRDQGNCHMFTTGPLQEDWYGSPCLCHRL